MTTISRRTLTASLVALTIAPATGTSAAMIPTAPARLIDTHQHFLPRVYIDAVGTEELARVMPTGRAPDWSADAALALMDANGIGEGIISISSGPHIPDAPGLLRACNEEAAALRQRHPGRFGSFASLPLPNIDASLTEVDHALGTLRADGFILFTNYGGRYLGDPSFRPLLAELDRRSAVVFIHPTAPPYALTGLPPESVLEFPFDTTRAAASLIMSGAMTAFPRIRFILSHAGGTLPYLAQRLAGGVMMNPALAERVGDPLAVIRRFWFDTALSMNAQALAALASIADPGRILFGSDFPMAPPVAIQGSVSGLATLAVDDQRRAIGYANAAILLGRPTA